jgi:SAM-dependent methyltransferase
MTSSNTLGNQTTGKPIAVRHIASVARRLDEFRAKYTLRARKTRFGLELARDFLFDRRYGGWCGGIVPATSPELQSSRTQSMHYLQLIRLFREVPIRPSDVLVDVGCGKGRVINYWLHMGCANRIVGIELNERVADWTRARLRQYQNVSVVTGNVLEHIPPDATLFFLYHPFGLAIMEQFAAAVSKTVRNLAELRIVYYNCVHRRVFDGGSCWAVSELTPVSPEPAVLVRPRQHWHPLVAFASPTAVK